ncbi:hypothetical protein CC80DRAFT_527823 [Byssothecium circinans]|uniref:WW domain-containing protein n=1 Tax=Byssothecium circinans TaxID=147558 RepID=A0A6A5TUF8_9PLEO|nr:hypothetical protein CC80DRAFT_527823 [Byssothecium circinans]
MLAASLLRASATLLGFASALPSLPMLQPRVACSGNTASTRSQWCDYSIDTDYSAEVPDTGVTREYWLELTDVVVSPDGISRSAMANGTSIHFHGIRQNYTNEMDGVASITQCPTAPGEKITYSWRAAQYDSSWYHSHFALQAYQGIFGAIIINGPATANYDVDMGTIFLNDWDHQVRPHHLIFQNTLTHPQTVDELFDSAQMYGPPTLANGLINGTNTYKDGGHRWNTTWQPGTSYRLRLVNAAVVIASDLVPVTPYNTTAVTIGMGQRYDVIITADQPPTASNFWLRAIPQSACSEIENAGDIKGIIQYSGSASTAPPSTTAWPVAYNSDNLFRWYLNSTTMQLSWSDPTLSQLLSGKTSFTASDAVVTLPNAHEWVYFVITTTLGVPHPIHLHGHDFFIIAQGSGEYSDSVQLNLDNPPRRDTAMLPASGFLAIAFETDNLGAWLMHCHIGWHASEGFAMQFIERWDEIAGLTDGRALGDTCAKWGEHAQVNGILQHDSGI